ncbi:ABC transporter transmembrane domain-containing protein [Nocardioides flavescens]|uniref:ABC transporter transmembrane domain-containing protein n=1 Tax=Nocardioides flavescens TaxID=2691959 RepID=UPI00136FADFE
MARPIDTQEAGRPARLLASLLSPLLASLRPPADPAPLVEAAKPMTVVDVVRRYWPDLRPLRWWLVALVALLAATPVVSVLEVVLFQRLVDDVLVPADLAPLVWIGLLYVGLNLLSAVLSGLDDLLSTWVSQRFLVRLRTQVFAHVLDHPGHVHDRTRLGDTMSRLTSDTAAVESFMIGQSATGAGALLRLGVYATALFWLQWQLALVAMVVAPMLWWIARHFSRLVKDVSRERRRRAGSLSAVTEERLSNAALVQTCNRQSDAVRDYHQQNLAIAAAELVGARIRAVFLPLADLAELVGTLAVIAGGTWALATDRLTLGGLMAFLALMVQCYSPLRTLGNLIPALHSATAGVERITELLDEELPRDASGARDLTLVRGSVELDGVRVRYPGAARDALVGTSLSIAAGELVALVGPSGAGKSTIARLLTRHVEPYAGAVRLDGHDLRDLTAHSVREAVTLVPQEIALMDATVAENIAFARPGASRLAVEEAARQADADAFVRALPAAYDTRVGQRGRTLSGGQRQRIALARALLRDAPVLFLDEPTSGLDAETSRRLLATLARHRGGRTVVIATHDPVVLEHVDRVVRLESDPRPEPLLAETQPLRTAAVR